MEGTSDGMDGWLHVCSYAIDQMQIKREKLKQVFVGRLPFRLQYFGKRRCCVLVLACCLAPSE